ncbi:methylation-associated defense system protein kinase MAD6 [Acidithiobacillus caldus]|uniref:non-specific serine/threonine protein kinase n=1 Tax=Acidithiobacillus caldus TaxID=33059 RepID=A0A1E7YP50_9PROT|nr:protein kinase [Acidithiobacillus caldus]OFC36758.1 protein kinase [Acidithiobacillus caldus]OFC39909.1 protein kinase [Acidithiobacillus caldus]OFC40023.1 protein kinase [Acidithiobacillus caldus]
MVKVIPIGQPANESERRAIGFLRDHLPDGWLIFHNFEMRQGEEVFEIDIAILAPHAVYLVDVKGTRGNIDVYGSKWYPEGRQPFFSPLAKLRSHAKTMATIIRESNTGLIELRKVHVHAAVLLTADDAAVFDQAGIDSPDVTDYKHCIKYFSDKSRIPNHRLNDIRKFTKIITDAIKGKAKPKTSATVFRDWQVEEKLGGTDRYTEYRAKHSLLGKRGGMARLRVYQTDPYQDEATRKEEFKKISNAYRAVAHMPTHANVLAVKDLFVSDDEDKVVLVTEDLPGQPLRLHINKASLALTFDQKLQVMRDVLSALDHTHRHEVIHRNLTPDAILVTKGGQARVTGFDYARVGKSRTSTIADQIIDDLEPAYQAPECFKDPTQASIASDLYAVGLIFYELLTGELPFESVDQMMEADGRFPMKPSEHKPDLAKGIDEWLQKFCEFDPEERHASAAIARKGLDDLILPEAKNDSAPDVSGLAVVVPQHPDNLMNLPQDFILANRFRIQKKLGSGGFGVAYKVFDSLGDVVRVIKLVTKDRRSVYERLRREYKTLTNLPDHPHVVKVIWADRMNDAKQTPYIVFEYVEGLDVSDLIDAEALSLDDAVRIVREAADGLAHLHKHGVYHQDVKPSNLLWTDKGVRIIDFNVAVSENDEVQGGGGTRRYLPPDYDYNSEPDASDRMDRDLYALGITFYECLTGKYPFDDPTPSIKTQPKDPKQFKGCADLSSSLVNVLLKMIAPERKDRFASADEFLTAMAEVKRLRAGSTTGEIGTGPKVVSKLGFEPTKPNTNPFVTHLLTLYSQSQVSNAGTRGLDEVGKATYVPTYLDEKLKPALLTGEFRLVIISGNAGDGKTAFIQQFEAFAESKGAQIQRGANGAVFQLKGHTYQSNYDGSQDEGDERNDAVLQKFFAPFAGKDASGWPENQTRLIAINEGRLVDFLLEHEEEFPLLAKQIQKGLAGAAPEGGIAVINLNLRSVVAEPEEGQPSILERLIARMTQQEYWQACEKCDLKGKCFAYHNARTFQDPVAGPKVIERLKMLYTITHLRGRLHITMRDLRSALAFMLVGTQDCDGIHQLYQNSGEETQNRILDGFYFNSWLGGAEGSNDRLIALLREIDVAEVSNPDLDRKLCFLAPDTHKPSRFSFDELANYDEALLETLFRNLPRDYSSKNRGRLIAKHRNYLSHMRRRHFFERRDIGWKEMLPYGSIDPFLDAIKQPGAKSTDEVTAILRAINRGEGLSDPARLGNQLALRVRQVDKGTIRSYRLFDGDHFTLRTEQETAAHPFLECLSQALVLLYDSGDGHKASLRINLDIYEMLMRLNNGYRPSIEEREGFYLSLAVFKNVLSAAPYQEVLLTESGFEFFQIRRDDKGNLHLGKVSRRAEA